MNRILVLTGEEEAFRVIYASNQSANRIDRALSTDNALQMCRGRRYDFLFVDLDLLRRSGEFNGYRAAFQEYWNLLPGLEIIVMAWPDRIRECVMAVKAGAGNYLTFPLHAEEVKYLMESTSESLIVRSELDYLRDQFWQAEALEIVHTENPRMQDVFQKVRSVAPTKSTVLLVGETGTGKGVIAGLLHRHSNRRDAQFISVHCGAIPDTLVESELFGHERGAFTGATKRKLGKFEIARGGTIFLDEIGTITPAAQIKLLQVLQEGIFQRVGGEDTIEADARVIAATNADLKAMFQQGLFRKDLYYRLNVFPIEIPPLRERLEDIPYFAEVFLKRMNRLYAKEIRGFSGDVLEAFSRYPWPGNLRELENLIERAYILESTNLLTRGSFPEEFFEAPSAVAGLTAQETLTLAEVRRRALEAVEKKYLDEQLSRNRGRIGDTALASGITTRQLHKLMKKHGLRKENYRPSPTRARRSGT